MPDVVEEDRRCKLYRVVSPNGISEEVLTMFVDEAERSEGLAGEDAAHGADRVVLELLVRERELDGHRIFT